MRRPPAAFVLTHMMNSLLATFREMTSDPWLTYQIDLIGPMMELLARECEEGASQRVQELTEIAHLLKRGDALTAGRFPWATNIPSDPLDDLRISSLDRRLDLLRRSLIEMQAWLEEDDSDGASALLKEVFAFEYAAAKRREIVRSE